MENAWQGRVGETDAPEPLHKKVREFLGTEVGSAHQDVLHRQHVERCEPGYADKRAEHLRQEMSRQIEARKARTELTPEAVSKLAEIMQEDFHHTPEMPPPPSGDHETYKDFINVLAFARQQRSNRREKYLELHDRVVDVVREFLPGAPSSKKKGDTGKGRLAGIADADAAVAKHLRLFGSNLEQLSHPADEANREAQAKARTFLIDHAGDVLTQARDHCGMEKIKADLALIRTLSDRLALLSDAERDDIKQKIKADADNLGFQGSLFAKEGKISPNYFFELGDKLLPIFEKHGILKPDETQGYSQDIAWWNAIEATLRGMKSDLAPIIAQARGSGRDQEM